MKLICGIGTGHVIKLLAYALCGVQVEAGSFRYRSSYFGRNQRKMFAPIGDVCADKKAARSVNVLAECRLVRGAEMWVIENPVLQMPLIGMVNTITS
jgi:hypothetical protein